MKQRSKSYLAGLLVLLWLVPSVVFAQTLTVEGTVHDETGAPLIGATVKVQPRGNGTVTDVDGRFHIPQVERGATLEFSYIGYLTQTRKADGRVISVTGDTIIGEQAHVYLQITFADSTSEEIGVPMVKVGRRWKMQ